MDLEDQFLEVVPGESVAFSFGPMRLEQTGCATEGAACASQHLNCRSRWVYFLTNLKSVLEHGTDLRHHDSPQLNDAVSIGWEPA